MTFDCLAAADSMARWDAVRSTRLQWVPELGLGFYPVPSLETYDADYFANYASLADTPIGRALNAERVAMLRRHWPNGRGVVDVGIGAGTFLEALPGARGYDVNPVGVEWLRARDRYVDPYREPIDVACFWDALEHIHNPTPLLDNVCHRVLVSLPIFRDAEHVLASKHYKPAEHVWYFTQRGLLWFMEAHGWHVLEISDVETRIGREDVKSYAFARA